MLQDLHVSLWNAYVDSRYVATAAEWRDKKEVITTLEAAIPWTQRGAGGADIWPLQLRDNWTRHVPLGNLFSGLFVEIKEKTCAEQAAYAALIPHQLCLMPGIADPHQASLCFTSIWQHLFGIPMTPKHELHYPATMHVSGTALLTVWGHCLVPRASHQQ